MAAEPFDFYWGYLAYTIWGLAFVHGAIRLTRLTVVAREPGARLGGQRIFD